MCEEDMNKDFDYFVKETEGIDTVRPHVLLNDGLEVSIQYSPYTYSKVDIHGYPITVEIYCKFVCLELLEYTDDCHISAFVPVSVVKKMIKKHGGIQKILY